MRALVTGAAGFVGAHLTRHLLAQGDAVLGVTVRADWSQQQGELNHADVPLVAWDISQEISEPARQAIEAFDPEVIYHLAAISLPAACGGDQPTPTSLAVNVEGTVRIAELALQLPRRPKLLFVSSSKVYGSRDAANMIAAETDEPNPAGGYGISKRMAEERLLEMTSQGLEVVIARAFNHTGPGQEPLYLVPQWCQKLASGQSPVHVRSLETTLDLSDVRDVVQIYRKLAISPQAAGLVNVGSGQPTLTGDIWRGICEVSGQQAEAIAEVEGPSVQPIADLERLHSFIGPHPRIPLSQTLADTWRTATSG